VPSPSAGIVMCIERLLRAGNQVPFFFFFPSHDRGFVLSRVYLHTAQYVWSLRSPTTLSCMSLFSLLFAPYYSLSCAMFCYLGSLNLVTSWWYRMWEVIPHTLQVCSDWFTEFGEQTMNGRVLCFIIVGSFEPCINAFELPWTFLCITAECRENKSRYIFTSVVCILKM